VGYFQLFSYSFLIVFIAAKGQAGCLCAFPNRRKRKSCW